MRQNIRCGYFAFDRTQMVEMVTWLAQYRETQHVEVLSYGLAYSLHSVDKEPLKACPHFNRLYGQLCRSCIPNLSRDHFIQMCAATDKITSELFFLMRQNRGCLSSINLKSIGSTVIKLW